MLDCLFEWQVFVRVVAVVKLFIGAFWNLLRHMLKLVVGLD